MGINLQAALLCYDSYFNTQRFKTAIEKNGVIAYLQEFDDHIAVVFPGSQTGEDWFRDFMFTMQEQPDLGGIETGFFIGMREIFANAHQLLNGRPLRILGHSLGAARANIFAALLVLSGYDTEKLHIIVFGCPKPGATKLQKILEKVAVNSFCNATDPVPQVPPSNLGYVHTRELTPVFAQCLAADPYLFMRDHHIQQYVVALALWERLHEQPSA